MTIHWKKACFKTLTSKFRPVDAKSYFRKWLDILQGKSDQATTTTTTQTDENETLDKCFQHAAFTVMTLPLMMDCNRPPRRRTTDIKLKDLQAAKQFLNVDTVKETQEITVKRAGSVKNTIQKYKMMTDATPANHNYYDFLKRNNNKSKDETDNIPLQDAEDFTPKGVIDVEKALLQNEEEEKKRSKVVKNQWSGNGTESELQLRLALEEFCDQQTPLNALQTLQVLFNIHKRIEEDPTCDKYYRVYVKGEIFERHVWILEGSQKYLKFAGWVKCGNYIILSKSYPVKQSVRVVEELLRKKKRAQVLHSGSVTSQHKRPDISIRRARSNVGESTIDEDAILESFTNIEAPNDTDSAIGSDEEVEQHKKHKLRRVESKEHIMGNEEYVVVDFVGALEVTSRKSSKPELMENDSLAESALGISSPESPMSNISFEAAFTGQDDIQAQENENSGGDDTSPDETESSLETKEKDVSEHVVPSEVSVPSDVNETKTQRKSSEGRKVSRGLKQVRQEQEEKKRKSSNDSQNSTSSKQSISTRQLSNGGLPSSNRSSLRSSRDKLLERSSSNRSLNNDRPSSIVMQNKMLFDQQIADGLKNKSQSSPREPRRRTSNLDLSNFERNRSDSNNSSLKDKQSLSNEIQLQGNTAANRDIFEQKNKFRPTKTKQPREEENIGTYRSIEQENINTPDQTNHTETSTPVDHNPLLARYHSTESITSSGKKKKFPFKKSNKDKKKLEKEKKKLEKKSSVELLNVKASVEEPFDERPIDCPAEVFAETTVEADVDETPEKKKKGLFSKIRRRSRKSSSDSEHELKHNNTLERKQSKTQEKIVEKDEQPEISVQNDKPVSDILNESESMLSDSFKTSKTASVDDTTADIIAKDDGVDTENGVNNVKDDPVLPDDVNTAVSDASVVLDTINERKQSVISTTESGGSKKKKKNPFKKKKKSSNAHTFVIRPEDIPVQSEEVTKQEDMTMDINNEIKNKDSVDAQIDTSIKSPELNQGENENTKSLVVEEEALSEQHMTDPRIDDLSFEKDDEQAILNDHVNCESDDIHLQQTDIETNVTLDTKDINEGTINDAKEDASNVTDEVTNTINDITNVGGGLYVTDDVTNVTVDVTNVTDNNTSLNEVDINTVNAGNTDTSVNPSSEVGIADEIVGVSPTISSALPTVTPASEDEQQSDNEGDDLADMLAEEAKHTNTINDDDNESIETTSLNSSVLSTTDTPHQKKKKRFKFPLKIKKHKNKKGSSELNSSVPTGLDDKHLDTPQKSSSLKLKRPKSLEILNDVFPRKSKNSTSSNKSPDSRPSSMTQEEIDQLELNGHIEGDEKSKKKKLSFFKRNKKKGDSMSSPTKSPSYTDTFVHTQPLSVTDESKHLSMDEFTIPENNIDVFVEKHSQNGHANNDVIEETSVPARKHSLGPDHKEYIKNKEVLEIKSSESMEF